MSQPTAAAFTEKHDAVLTQRVLHHAFFDKLARAYSIQPQSVEDQVHLLEIGEMLTAAATADNAKSAAASGDWLAGTCRELHALLVKNGTVTATNADDPYAKRAAFEMALDPEIAEAALALAQDSASGLA